MFHPLMQRLVSKLEFESVCEFGNQRFAGEGDFNSTKDYYAHLGCKDYLALDVNDSMDAVVADLNGPVMDVVKRQFDLVTNNGTGEHIWNQHHVFKNAHDLSRRHILHVLPMAPWVNHGFFNYNPVLFRDIAKANSYKADVFLANRWGTSEHLPPDELYREKNPYVLEQVVSKLSKRGGVFVVAIFEKDSSSSPFRMPFQGKYLDSIRDDGLTARYS